MTDEHGPALVRAYPASPAGFECVVGMNCIECFHRDGAFRPAWFVVNGQSLCQTHVHVAIVDPGQQAKAYAWTSDDVEPVLL